MGAVGVGLSTLAFAFVDGFIAGMVVVLLLGVFTSLVAIGSQTEVQVSVDNRLRGRVMSMWTITIVGGPAIGSAVAGALAGSIGTTATSLSFALACLLLILAVGIANPRQAVD